MTLSMLRLLFTGSMYKKSPLEPEGPDKKFEEDVHRELSFLFTKHDARIVTNFYYPRSFGNAVIVVQVRDLFLQVVRDRGDICVYVGKTPSGQAEGPWTDIRVAIASLEINETRANIPDLPFYATLSRAAALLEPALPRLEEAYSGSKYEATLRKIRQINEASWEKFKEGTRKNAKRGKLSA
jgi:hypothetical protein